MFVQWHTTDGSESRRNSCWNFQSRPGWRSVALLVRTVCTYAVLYEDGVPVGTGTSYNRLYCSTVVLVRRTGTRTVDYCITSSLLVIE